MRVFWTGVVGMALTAAAPADEVRLVSGETVRGTVAKTTGSRVLLRLDGSGVRSYHKRQIEAAVRTDGGVIPLGIELSKEPLSADEAALLRQVASVGQALTDPRVKALLDDCSEAAVEELERLVTDPLCKTRDAALGMLGLAGAPRAVRALVRVATGDTDPKIRFAAANQLMAPHVIRCVGSEGLLDAVKAGLGDKDRNTGYCLAYVTGRLGDADAVPVLKRNLKNPDHHFRESAALLLAEMGDDAGVPVLLRALRAKGAERDVEKIRICRALGALGSRTALPALRKLRKSKNARLAAAATDAVQAIEAAE